MQNYNKISARSKSGQFLVLMLFSLVLAACSPGSNSQQGTISGNKLSAPLPGAVAALALDEANLVVDLVVDGDTTLRVDNLVVDIANGTFSGKIPAISAGSYTLSLVYSVIDPSHGTIEVATASSITVNVIANQETPADFSSATLTFADTDGDGISNRDELDEGSNPTEPSYYVGGTVSGLVGSGAVLQLNDGNNLTLTSDGRFHFVPALADAGAYVVTITSQPNNPSQICSVTHGSGTVSEANVGAVAVQCANVIVSTVAGGDRSCALWAQGQAMCWGRNQYGELGLPATPSAIGDEAAEMGDALAVVDLASGNMPVSVSNGGSHSCVLFDNGTVTCWGRNEFGQLGQGHAYTVGDETDDMGNNLLAIDLGSGRKATTITSGESHSCALLDDGTVKCWGSNVVGRLGQGHANPLGDEPNEMGDDLSAIDLGSGRTATAITAGTGHNCALLDNGMVKCWGDNWDGQLGQGHANALGDELNEMGDSLPAIDLGSGRTATAITAGSFHSCALLDNSTVKCWGHNRSGQLGQGHTDQLGKEANEMGDNLPAIDLGSGRIATAITVGSFHSCALLDNDTVKCWGLNGNGQLGQGHTRQLGDEVDETGDSLPAIDLGSGCTAISLTAGSSYSCALLDNGTTKCWGINGNGQLGQGHTHRLGSDVDEMGDSLPAIDLGSGRTATAITTGASHSCALLDDSTVKCWGNNGFGQLGIGQGSQPGDEASEMGQALPIVNIGENASFMAIGASHSCALLDNGTVKCWGLNGDGQLGQGHTNALGDDANEMGENLPVIDLGSGRTAMRLTAGSFHSCALLDNSTVKCWGANRSGQLGQGHTTALGGKVDEMGENLPVIDLGSGRTATAITTGTSHSCALLDNSTVKCWGRNEFGQLGQGHTTALGDKIDELGDNLLAIDLGSGRTATAITAGTSHSCALLDNGAVKCWGDNESGQLGQGHATALGDELNEMSDNLPAIDLGNGRTATAITTEGFHNCALLDNGTVKCWGANKSGQLGQGHATVLGDEPDEMGDNLLVIDLGSGRMATVITSGESHNCALLDDGTVKCWGHNESGQLGQGHAYHRGNKANQMGDNLPAIDLQL